MREARLSRHWAAIGAVGTLLAIVVSVVIALTTGSASSSRSDGSLEVVDSVVINTRPELTPTRIDLKLHNLSTRRIVLRRALITVEQVEQLSLCYTQGDLAVSNDYPVTLPTHRGVVRVPLNQQIGPDAADRFTLSLDVPREPAREGSEPHLYVLRFRVAIGHDGSARPLEVGQFVMGFPNAPSGVVWYWPKDYEGKSREDLAQAFNFAFPYAAYMRRCWAPNTIRLRRILRLPGERSDDMKATLGDLADRLDPPS